MRSWVDRALREDLDNADNAARVRGDPGMNAAACLSAADSIRLMRPFPMTRFSLLFAAALLATPLFAHHSFTMFDMSKKVTMTGTVTSFEWTNPHAYIEID